MDEDDELIPISALQHWLYCPRQCALIHVERAWAENAATAEGRLLHRVADETAHETQAGVKVLRGAYLASQRLGVWGRADVVEIQLDGSHPHPIEYKRGKPKAHRADEVQLCAQAMCLEEMFGVPVEEGSLFYGKTRRRHVVAIDGELRRLTSAVAAEVRLTIAEGRVPAASYEKSRCEPCSLLELCRPRTLSRPPEIGAWLARQVEARGDDDP
jgi:CRISPR-associated exonuclease Cas4